MKEMIRNLEKLLIARLGLIALLISLGLYTRRFERILKFGKIDIINLYRLLNSRYKFICEI